MYADNNETIITSNKHDNKDYFSARSNEERMKTESNHQDKLAANRYADENNDNWNTHAPQYAGREEKPKRMRENRNATQMHAPKGEETNRYLAYGLLINNVVTSRHAQLRVETRTKQNARHRLETNRFSHHRFATNRNAIKQSSFLTDHSGGAVSTDKYPTGNKNI